MANAVTARWHGDNYQARIFWENAFNLLDEHSCVIEVTFEADGPKSFDDIVVRYDPPVVRSGPARIAADYHQIKWHVETGGRFGYQDLIDHDFIGAQSISLLQRLKEARQKVPEGQNAHFSLLTTYRIRDDDPLARLVSGHDRTLLIERLFDGTTDRSKMGKVRKLWREHLELPDDNALKAVITGFRIIDGHRSLDELRSEINNKAKAAGIKAFSAAGSDFKYDELARQMKVRQLNRLTRETLLELCESEGLLLKRQPLEEQFLPVAIRSFLGPAADIVGSTPENSLILTDAFRQRYVQDGLEWQKDIRPQVSEFLRAVVKKSPKLRLILDVHASIAFLGGAVLDAKSGVSTELVQKGRVGSRIWRADDGTIGLPLETIEEVIGQGNEIAVGISIAHKLGPHVRRFVGKNLPNVGPFLMFEFQEGPGHHNVAGGGHAAALAEQISFGVRKLREEDPDILVHIFAACPNSLLFFLGQHHQAIAPCIIYEFDFDRQGNKSYQPSFVID